MNRPYDCDPAKALENLRKHAVSFDEGFEVLQMPDEDCLDLIDDRVDYGEERWVRIGPHRSVPFLLLHVVWTEDAGRPRLISVRKATRLEYRRHANRYAKPL